LLVILSCVTAQQTGIYEPLPLPVADYALAPPLVVGAAGGPDDSGNNDGNGELTAASVPLLPSADDLPDGDIMEGASAWRFVCVCATWLWIKGGGKGQAHRARAHQ
jgi:hypothetical protein